jgi:hypothetical protein
VLLAGGEGHRVFLADFRAPVVEGVHTVEQSVIRGERCNSFLVESFEGRLVVPIHDGENAHVDIPVGARRSVDDEGPRQTVGVLEREMAVIPGVSVGCALKGVGE